MARETAKPAARKDSTKVRSTRITKKDPVAAEKPVASPVDAEIRRSQLKTLITMGKERGYLTYGEISDHLPDDVADAEQIEGIIATFNNMGIQVYDEAPAAEDLLMTDNVPNSVDEDVAEEEAEQALSSVDSEFGRTTDPVRMYMREMGTVSLLTRRPKPEQVEGIIWSAATAKLPAAERERNRGMRNFALWWFIYIGIVAAGYGFIIWFQFWGPGAAIKP